MQDEANAQEVLTPEQSYTQYRRKFGLVWQALRHSGQDQRLEPELVHQILRLAGVIPFRNFHVEIGDREASIPAVRANHDYRANQNVLFLRLPIPEDGCTIQDIYIQVSSCDQVSSVSVCFLCSLCDC
jgi:hypothetical protein